MGTLATESYIRLVNRETYAHSDQEFLDYVVFNDAPCPTGPRSSSGSPTMTRSR